MKREVRQLLGKAIDSLILSIEHFNRPDDRGRVASVLILMDHSFEMVLKASILHRGGRIREPRRRETQGFDRCVRIGLDTPSVRFLSEDDALTLQTINGLRDAAYHHLIEVSEAHLYVQTQAGVTLFADILKKVFGRPLSDHLPRRVLPIGTDAPTDVGTMFSEEVGQIRRLLAPGKRKRTEAFARIRPLAIVDATIAGERTQPSEGELRKIAAGITRGRTWGEVFPSAASVQYATSGTGPSVQLRLSRKEGIPVALVKEGAPGAHVVAVRKIRELDYYNLNHTQLSVKVGLTPPKTTAVVWFLRLKEDEECFKEFRIGKSRHGCYSQAAIPKIKAAVAEHGEASIWGKYRKRGMKKRSS